MPTRQRRRGRHHDTRPGSGASVATGDIGTASDEQLGLGDLPDREAYFVAKILKGAKPSNLPVEQHTKFKFMINQKTAKALGVTVPPLVLAMADQIIE
jgi:putative ABC transport system substrate-binding protein